MCIEMLDHPNIIKLYEIIESFSKLHLVMEVAGEGDLQSRVSKEGAIAETQARPIFVQITAAIQHMHQKGVIHRDLKAENVFFVSNNLIKVGDFGFSTQAHVDKLLDTFCGSPQYAAPELFSEESYSGPPIDVWAMGVTLYFILCARLPFNGDYVPELKAIIQRGNYIPLEKISRSCKALIEGLLTVNPKDWWSLDNVHSSAWVRSGKATSSIVRSNTSFNKNGTDSVHLSVLNELQQLGAPTTNGGVFCGEPRNSVAGAYRILMHKRANVESAGKDPEIEKLQHPHHKKVAVPETYTAMKQNKLNSKFCMIL